MLVNSSWVSVTSGDVIWSPLGLIYTFSWISTLPFFFFAVWNDLSTLFESISSRLQSVAFGVYAGYSLEQRSCIIPEKHTCHDKTSHANLSIFWKPLLFLRSMNRWSFVRMSHSLNSEDKVHFKCEVNARAFRDVKTDMNSSHKTSWIIEGPVGVLNTSILPQLNNCSD